MSVPKCSLPAFFFFFFSPLPSQLAVSLNPRLARTPVREAYLNPASLLTSEFLEYGRVTLAMEQPAVSLSAHASTFLETLPGHELYSHSPGCEGSTRPVPGQPAGPTSVASTHRSVCQGTQIVATTLSYLQVFLGTQVGNGLLDPKGREPRRRVVVPALLHYLGHDSQSLA